MRGREIVVYLYKFTVILYYYRELGADGLGCGGCGGAGSN